MKAVIQINAHQHIVEAGDEITVSRLNGEKKTLSFEPLLIFDENQVQVGTPSVAGSTVSAELKGESLGDKTISIRYEAKKRVNKIRGHRQKLTTLVIKKIDTKTAK